MNIVRFQIQGTHTFAFRAIQMGTHESDRPNERNKEKCK